MSYRRPDSRYPLNWNKLRYYIFKRDRYICQICGRGPLRHPVCHHLRPVGVGGSHHSNNLITVCNSCHKRIHNIK